MPTVLEPTTLRNQMCYHNTHIQAVPGSAHPRTWLLEWREWQESNSFYLYGRSVQGPLAIMFTGISCQMSILAIRDESENTTLSSAGIYNSFKESLTELCTNCSDDFRLLLQPLPARPSLSGEFCSHGSSHEEAYLNFSVDHMDFRFVYAHLLEGFV